MKRLLLISAIVWTFIPASLGSSGEKSAPAGGAISFKFSNDDWPWWRGPTRDGVARAEQQPPRKWSATENIVWRAPVPGRGHGSPTVVGNQVFLATADYENEVQSVLCFDRRTGDKLWQTEIHRGEFEKKGNKKSTLASATVACDGERVFINFLHAGAIYTTALDRDGKRLWQTKITDYVEHQGYGSSPTVYGKLVLVSADNKGGGAVAALDRVSGDVVWRHDRPKQPNYTSPIVLNVAGREQLIFIGCDMVSSYDPLSGSRLWEKPGATTECVTSTVTDGNLVYTTGGYPKNHLAAMRADGSGTVVWENTSRVYVPSLLIRDGYLYGVLDAGMATCWKADNGKEQWKMRLGGTFSSSPVLVDDNIYATSEAGKTFIFKANPGAYEPVAENDLGEDVFASPTICGGRIYMRVAKLTDGQRQEMLYCVGKK